MIQSKRIPIYVCAALAALLAAVLAFTVFPGKTPPVRNEADLSSDLQSADTFLSRNSFTIEKLSVDKRRTDTENLRDNVYVTVSAKNTIAVITLHMQMEYALADGAWKLSSVSNDRTGEWKATPLLGADEALIAQTLEKIGTYYLKNASYEARNTDLAAGTDELIYACSYNEGAVHMDYQVRFQFAFDSRNARWQLKSYSADQFPADEQAFIYDFFRIAQRKVRWDTVSLTGEYRDEYRLLGSHFYLTMHEDGTMNYDYLEGRYEDAYYGSVKLTDFTQTDLMTFTYEKRYPGHFEITIENGKIVSPLTTDGWDSILLKYK